jgi:hypothetical protein
MALDEVGDVVHIGLVCDPDSILNRVVKGQVLVSVDRPSDLAFLNIAVSSGFVLPEVAEIDKGLD